VVVEREGIELDWCLHCAGLWFDEGELELLAEKTGRRLEAEDVGLAATERGSGKGRRCPRCKKKMDEVAAGRRLPVQVDRCDDHGVWLDRGELGRILGQIETDPDSDEAVIVGFLGETFRAAGGSGDPSGSTR
jgi:Zn-finger nucleic acid-binding protein